jgi:hypothetical protein
MCHALCWWCTAEWSLVLLAAIPLNLDRLVTGAWLKNAAGGFIAALQPPTALPLTVSTSPASSTPRGPPPTTSTLRAAFTRAARPCSRQRKGRRVVTVHCRMAGSEAEDVNRRRKQCMLELAGALQWSTSQLA